MQQHEVQEPYTRGASLRLKTSFGIRQHYGMKLQTSDQLNLLCQSKKLGGQEMCICRIWARISFNHGIRVPKSISSIIRCGMLHLPLPVYEFNGELTPS